MEIFFPNQRYISEGEPELGVGVLTEVSKGKVQIFFPESDETRLYASDYAPLRRVVFKAGDTIVDIKKQSLLVEKVELVDNLYIYYGNNRAISEADLGNVSVQHGAEDRLFNGDVDLPEMFDLRRKTLQFDYLRRISPIKGFMGGRIDLIPHQLYIAHEVSSRYAPRVLLSDQVGLGKTIEACLIIHRLLLSGRISRVLILVPESLVHQWFVEVLRRFNLWFNIFDEARCASLDESAPDGNPFLDNQLIICSTEFLASSATRAGQAITAGWDMLVVDEAHHLEWTAEKVSPEYAIVELLSKVAKGLLLLTATPEQLGVESHFARLRLLDPIRYANYNDFVNESSDNREIANVVEKLSADKKLLVKEKQLLASIFPKERIDSLADGGASAKNNLIEDLLDQHGPGRVLFRNTRSAMRGFPKRKAHLVPLTSEDDGLWRTRLTGEFEVDLVTTKSNATNPHFWFSDDPRVVWLLQTMKKLRRSKILLICKSREKVLALEEALSSATTKKIAVFHEELTIIQRDRNAAWFSEADGAQILLCSEIGSEGRNFQFAHHLILFDLPFHPELLEQRIGRLDRIGQTEDIHIHIPYLLNTPQHLLVRWYHEGLNAFEENIEGGNVISKVFSERILAISKSDMLAEVDAQLEGIIADTATFQKELKASLADGRDKLLEMNSFRPIVAAELVDKIKASDSDNTLDMFLTKVFDHFNVETEDLAPRTYLLHPTSESSEVFPSIPPQGVSVTFDRKRALSREDMQFISWDHPMTTDAIDMVLTTGTGSASFGVLRGTGKPGLLLELLFVLETAGEQSILVDRFLSNTFLRVVVDHTGKDVSNLYGIDAFDKKLIPGQIDVLLDNDTFMETILPNMLSMATNMAEKQGAKEISMGLQRMNDTLNHEIARLTELQKKNRDVRAEEIEVAMAEQSKLASLLKNARVRLDAIQLIRKE